MDVSIIDLGRGNIRSFWDQILDVYRASFAEPPYNRDEMHVIDFSGSLERHVELSGFRFKAARDRASGELLGIAYGYTSQRGQWWHDVVARSAGPEMASDWLTGAFELVEFAVKPTAQGQGIGARLHDAVLAQLPHMRAVLSTMLADTVAYHMYLRRGWLTLLEPFYFPSVLKPYRIMGLDLVMWRARYPIANNPPTNNGFDDVATG
jgi:GNAT superfamily N-acetyltransferase